MTTPTRRRVLVTGATGLLGAYIARLLVRDAGLEVRATKRASSSTALLAEAAARIDWVTGDLLDLDVQDEAMDGVDVVVHAAGLVSYKPGDSKRLKAVNVGLTEDLVNLALEREVSQFVHVSSIAAISPARDTETISERHRTFHPAANTTRYAVSKYEGELHVWRGHEEGLPVTILNPSVVLGAGYWDRSSCRLFDWVARGQRFYPPGGTGYVDVRDIAAFAKTCIDESITGRRFVLSAENWTYKRFFDAVAAELNVEPPRTRVNPWQAELAWRGEAVRAAVTGDTPLLTKESARRSMSLSEFDNAQSLATGARYRPVAETIAQTAEAYAKTRDAGFGVLPIE